MVRHKIFFSNLGYARGLSGRLAEHLLYAYRHFYCSPLIQKEALRQLAELIAREEPDICCLVEIEKGTPNRKKLNQLEALINETYPNFDIENKYGEKSLLRSFNFTSGKSNAFLAKRKHVFEKLYFTRGVKRLVYKIHVDENLTLFFAHFSLKKTIRAWQLIEARNLMRAVEGEVIFLGDFNILSGFGEIVPLLDGGRFVLLNREEHPTFFFHKHQKILDLCICSRGVAGRAELSVLPQPYSDHAALLLNIRSGG
ncbi:MAG: endonuclease/exonuclease/phosphatase family protein [Bdellovibrionales bacterium]